MVSFFFQSFCKSAANFTFKMVAVATRNSMFDLVPATKDTEQTMESFLSSLERSRELPQHSEGFINQESGQ